MPSQNSNQGAAGSEAESTVQAAQTSGDNDQQAETAEQQVHEEVEQHEEEQAEKVEVDIKSIVKTKDGGYEWRINPSDPKSMVYKGTNLEELLGNVAKNIQDKDSYIQKLKGAVKLNPSSAIGKRPAGDSQGEDQDTVVFPDRDEILRAELTRSGMKAEMLSWDKNRWREYEQENGAVETMELKQALRETIGRAEARFAQENVVSINNHTLLEESDAVGELLESAGLTIEDFDYDAVLADVYANPNNFLKNGVRKNGRIVAESAKVISKIVQDKVREETKKGTEEEIATNRTKKPSSESVGKTGGGQKFNKPLVKAPKTTAEALVEAKKMLQFRK